jgi:dethiobiotin synthetase
MSEIKGWFVTGTDTGVGKTTIACALVRALRARAVRVAVAKPVASGAKRTAQGLRNDDALKLAAAANVDVTATQNYQRINPFCFEPPIAPHIAAADAGVAIDVAALAARIGTNASENDWLMVEGAGGWRVPLDATRDFSDLAVALDLPVVLVVGLRLGCINHALLSAESIAACGLKLAGWIANGIDPGMARQAENVATLTARLGMPPAMLVPHGATVAETAALAEPAIDRLMVGFSTRRTG